MRRTRTGTLARMLVGAVALSATGCSSGEIKDSKVRRWIADSLRRHLDSLTTRVCELSRGERDGQLCSPI